MYHHHSKEVFGEIILFVLRARLQADVFYWGPACSRRPDLTMICSILGEEEDNDGGTESMVLSETRVLEAHGVHVMDEWPD